MRYDITSHTVTLLRPLKTAVSVASNPTSDCGLHCRHDIRHLGWSYVSYKYCRAHCRFRTVQNTARYLWIKFTNISRNPYKPFLKKPNVYTFVNQINNFIRKKDNIIFAVMAISFYTLRYICPCAKVPSHQGVQRGKGKSWTQSPALVLGVVGIILRLPLFMEKPVCYSSDRRLCALLCKSSTISAYDWYDL
jgi:hypothetical protein